MAVVRQTFLSQNSARSYPFDDSCDAVSDLSSSSSDDRVDFVRKSLLSDIQISVPMTLGELGAAVYVRSAVVSPNYASLAVAMDGVGDIATLEVMQPQYGRSYAMVAASDGVLASVVFGAAAAPDSEAAIAELTPTSGRILDSLVFRYMVRTVSGIAVGDDVIDGDVNIVGADGIVVATEEVTIVTPTATRRQLSVVIRQEEDIDTRLAPVAACNIPLETGIVTDVISAINGILPNDNGEIILEIVSDTYTNEDGEEVPYIEASAAGLGVVGLTSNWNAKLACDDRRPTIIYANRRCELCGPSNDNVGDGGDAQSGTFVSYDGGYIQGSVLTLKWTYYGGGSLVAGDDPLAIAISILNESGDVDTEAEACEVIDVLVVEGTSPTLPGPLSGGGCQYSSPGGMGVPGRSQYRLSRSLYAGSRVLVDAGQGLVKEMMGNLFQGYSEHNSRAFTTCSLNVKEA